MVRLEWAAVYGGLNLIILLALSFAVSAARRKHKVSLGDGGNPAVLRAIRAHGNAAETIPVGLAGLTLLALLDPAAPLWLFHAAGITLTAGRLLHGAGLSMGDLNAGRVLGSFLTLLALALMAGGLLTAGLAGRL